MKQWCRMIGSMANRKLLLAAQDIHADVLFSDCQHYRYALWRHWKPQQPFALFIGLNPSTTEGNDDNPTIRRCMDFAFRWGYGGLCLANLFAYRADTPQQLIKVAKPHGPDNDRWLQKLAKDAGIVVAAWGNHGAHLQRSQEVQRLLPPMYCLKMNKSGEPAHPLYQPKDARVSLMPTLEV